MKLKKIFYILALIAISNCSFSQSSNKIPTINIAYTFDSSELSLVYNLETKDEVEIYKNLRVASNCDEWFMDVVIITEKFSDTSQTYIPLSCGADIQPALFSDGSLGPMIKFKNSKTPDRKVLISKADLRNENGKYRLKIRFYYFIKGQRLFAESRYVYFSFSQ